MCDRHDAIRYLISNAHGKKQELVAKITIHQYESFLTTGMIYELASSPEEVEEQPETEWVASKFAFERARLLNIMPGKKFRLDSSSKLKIYNHQNVLIKIFGLLGII